MTWLLLSQGSATTPIQKMKTGDWLYWITANLDSVKRDTLGSITKMANDSAVQTWTDSIAVYDLRRLASVVDSLTALESRTIVRSDCLSIALRDTIFSKNDSLGTAYEDSVAQGLLDAKAYTDVRETAITTAYEGAVSDSLDVIQNIRVLLPDTLSAVVGDTLQIFYRGIVEAPNLYNYHVVVSCAKGRMYNRYFEYAPVATDTTATYPLILRVYSPQFRLLGSDTTVVRAESVWHSSVATILPLGDSFTSSSYWATEFYRRLTGTGGTPAGNALTGITTIGNLGVAPNQRIGYSAKTWSFYATETAVASTTKFWFFSTHDKDTTDYTSVWSDGANNWTLDSLHVGKLAFTKTGHTVSAPASGTLTHVSGATHTGDITYTSIESIDGNPLWDYSTSALSFAAYCTRNSFADIDLGIFLMTWNECIYNNYYLASMINTTYCRTVLDVFHVDFPTAKIMLAPPTMPPAFSGLSSDYYGATNYAYYYGLVRTVNGYNLAMKSLIKESAYKDWVTYCPIVIGFDNEYGFNVTSTTKKVNIRDTSNLREYISINYIHPSQYGYYQIADVIYREFVRLYCRGN